MDPFLTRFSQISTGPEYTLALDQDGHIWSWGRNDSYQLGDGTNVDRAVPARIDPDPEHPNLRFVQVQAADTRAWRWMRTACCGGGETTTIGRSPHRPHRWSMPEAR